MRGRLLECYRSGIRGRFICCDRWPCLPSRWCDGCTNICTHLAMMGSDIEVARAQLATAPDRDQHPIGGADMADGTRPVAVS